MLLLKLQNDNTLYGDILGRTDHLRKCRHRRYQSTLTAGGNPKITTHPSVVGRSGEEWEGEEYY